VTAADVVEAVKLQTDQDLSTKTIEMDDQIREVSTQGTFAFKERLASFREHLARVREHFAFREHGACFREHFG
jgi:hypothetical protein